MKSLQIILIILCVLFSSHLLNAQDDSTILYSKLPIKITFGNHAVGFPYQNSFISFNPYFSVGTELGLNNNKKQQFLLASNLGFINNKVIGNTIILDIDLGYRYTSNPGVYFETALSLGALNQHQSVDLYKQNKSDGIFFKEKGKGYFSSLIGLKMGIGYDFTKQTSLPWAIGLTHNFFIQTSYFAVANFPIMPQSTTNISITYKFKKS